ncbi:hypothetical protein PC39_00090 [Salinisphaera sp. PC39]|uniref:hypothetical protein n=1 Tax=Salinisphaera sp. PC39 TaxID=1304156 RepID=UPI003341E5D9
MSEPSRLTRPLLPHVDAERVPLTRFVLPSFFVCSMTLWIVGPAEVVGRLTQVVGALAVLCAGINLCRVAWYVRAFLHRHQTRLDAVAERRLARLRRAIYGMGGVLFGTALCAVGYYIVTAGMLGDTPPAGETRLLWTLTVGGLVLSIVFGELVTHLVGVVDAAMAELERRLERS